MQPSPNISTGSMDSRDQHAPYISVVVTARNDDHGGNLLHRMQVFVDAWINQTKRHHLDSELIIVEWNPPGERVRLREALRWPEDTGPCRVRIIEAPPEVHDRYRHAAALPLYQMIAKNAGIRRARGEFVLATNIDIVFSDELVQFLASRRLERGRLYRIDRHDVMSDVPVDGTLDEQLAYCRSHVIRLCAREGICQLTAEGMRQNEPEDITRPDSGIHFGMGWSPVERWDLREPFRWIDNDCEILARVPQGGAVLLLEVEPGPGVRRTPQALQVLDRSGSKVAEWKIAGRTTLNLVAPAPPNGGVQSFRLHVPGGGRAVLNDLRILNFRVFHCDWVEPSSGAATPRTPVSVIRENRPMLTRLLVGWRQSRGLLSLAREGLSVLRGAVRLLSARGADVIGDGMEFWAGGGLYEMEHAGGERFRWASQDAQLLMRPSSESEGVALLLEAGPGVAFQPFILAIRDQSGRVLNRVGIHGLSYVEVPLSLPRGRITALILHAENGGLPTPEDPRILNFRLIACGAGCRDVRAKPTFESDTSESWTALTVASRPAEFDWSARLIEWCRQIEDMGEQVFLHTNACGDFTLMAREDWHEMRGYAELDLFSIHLDSLLCYAAHCAGVREEILREPMRIYHIEHSVGSGWTPEGQQELAARIARRGIHLLSFDDVLWIIGTMRSLHAPLIFNLDDWGLAKSELPESAPAAAAYVS